MDSSDPNLELLKKLSFNLNSSITIAERETKRSREQLHALAFSKGLVDETVKALTNGELPKTNYPSALSFSSSIALPMCEQFNATPPGSGRSFICDQIQTSVLNGVSSFVSAATTQIRAGLEPLTAMLTDHRGDLVSLEERLSSRLANYSAHLQSILEGALQSYRDVGNKLRFTNAGNALRELLREFLEVIAADAKVKKAPWFVADTTSKTGVTRRHRINYAIFRNLTADKFPKTFVDQADATAIELLRHISKLSELTHVTEAVLEKKYTETSILFAEVMQRFLLLISAIETANALVSQDIAADIQTHLDGVFTSDFFNELDVLSTHTRPQGASDVRVQEATFDEKWIEFKGIGTVECDLQWGSDGDVERGDGVENSLSFPFAFSGRVPIDDLTQIEVDRQNIAIDTSSFYG